jgi:hypothetical protein
MFPILFCRPYFEEKAFKKFHSKLRLKIEESYSNNEEISNT